MLVALNKGRMTVVTTPQTSSGPTREARVKRALCGAVLQTRGWFNLGLGRILEPMDTTSASSKPEAP